MKLSLIVCGILPTLITGQGAGDLCKANVSVLYSVALFILKNY